MINILLVDDHPAVIEGTKLLMEQEEDMRVYSALSVRQALEMTQKQKFDVMLFDLNMPEMSGIELAKKVLAKSPEATILIYTGNDFQNHFNLMVETEISGFLSKTANKEQLVTAVRCALRGEVIIPLGLMKQLRRTTASINTNAHTSETTAISDKEREILREIAQGNSNKAIAETLHMSQRSLEYGLTNLFHKLNVKSRFEAAMKAKQMGYLDDMDFSQSI